MLFVLLIFFYSLRLIHFHSSYSHSFVRFFNTFVYISWNCSHWKGCFRCRVDSLDPFSMRVIEFRRIGFFQVLWDRRERLSSEKKFWDKEITQLQAELNFRNGKKSARQSKRQRVWVRGRNAKQRNYSDNFRVDRKKDVLSVKHCASKLFNFIFNHEKFDYHILARQWVKERMRCHKLVPLLAISFTGLRKFARFSPIELLNRAVGKVLRSVRDQKFR